MWFNTFLHRLYIKSINLKRFPLRDFDNNGFKEQTKPVQDVYNLIKMIHLNATKSLDKYFSDI